MFVLKRIIMSALAIAATVFFTIYFLNIGEMAFPGWMAKNAAGGNIPYRTLLDGLIFVVYFHIVCIATPRTFWHAPGKIYGVITSSVNIVLGVLFFLCMINVIPVTKSIPLLRPYATSLYFFLFVVCFGIIGLFIPIYHRIKYQTFEYGIVLKSFSQRLIVYVYEALFILVFALGFGMTIYIHTNIGVIFEGFFDVLATPWWFNAIIFLAAFIVHVFVAVKGIIETDNDLNNKKLFYDKTIFLPLALISVIFVIARFVSVFAFYSGHGSSGIFASLIVNLGLFIYTLFAVFADKIDWSKFATEPIKPRDPEPVKPKEEEKKEERIYTVTGYKVSYSVIRTYDDPIFHTKIGDYDISVTFEYSDNYGHSGTTTKSMILTGQDEYAIDGAVQHEFGWLIGYKGRDIP